VALEIHTELAFSVSLGICEVLLPQAFLGFQQFRLLHKRSSQLQWRRPDILLACHCEERSNLNCLHSSNVWGLKYFLIASSCHCEERSNLNCLHLSSARDSHRTSLFRFARDKRGPVISSLLGIPAV